jgi:hypothetical protein
MQTNSEPMNKNKNSILNAFFASLDCDLEIGIATCLSHALNISIPEVFTAYEAWQIS